MVVAVGSLSIARSDVAMAQASTVSVGCQGAGFILSLFSETVTAGPLGYSPSFTSTQTYNAGEVLTITMSVTPTTGVAHFQLTDLTAGAVVASSALSGSSSVTVNYVIPATGSRMFIYTKQVAPNVTATYTHSISCGLPSAAASAPAVDLGKTAKSMTSFVIGQIVPENAKSVSDMINQRFQGAGGAIVNSASSSTHVRVQLADIARLGADAAQRKRSRDQAAESGRDTPRRGTQPDFNVWIDGRALAVGSGEADGSIYSVLGGADYLVAPNLLLGVAVGHEGYDLDTGIAAGRFRGRGYTAGPYAGVLLGNALVFDIWAAGTFLNYRISESGVSGDFDARRWFVSANLTGTWRLGRWRIAPRLSLHYAEEHQSSYNDSAGTSVSRQSVHLGRFAFGPEIGYAIGEIGPFRAVEPFVVLRGEYDFARNGEFTLNNGTVVDPGRLGARLSFGANGNLGRIKLHIEGNYNSIGRSGQNVWGGALRLSLPF